jgi:hypothetical protein
VPKIEEALTGSFKCFFNWIFLMDEPEVELIFTFKLAFALDTPYPSRAAQASRLWTPPTRPEQRKRQVVEWHPNSIRKSQFSIKAE